MDQVAPVSQCDLKSHGLQPSSDISGHRTRCKMMKVCCHSVLHEVLRQLIMLHFFCCKMLQISTPTSLSDTEMARKFFDLEILQLVTLGFPAGEAWTSARGRKSPGFYQSARAKQFPFSLEQSQYLNITQ